MNINKSDTVDQLINTSSNDSAHMEGHSDTVNFPVYFSNKVLKMVLDAVFLIVNCVIVFAMWRK